MQGKLFIASVLILGSFVSANAADLPTEKGPPAYVPPPPPAFSWTGFYVGAFAGAALTSNATTADPCLVGANCTNIGTYNAVRPITYGLRDSFAGGGEIGYNWQIAPNFLIGFENKIGYTHLSGSVIMNPTGNGDTSANTRIGDWFDAYTVRVGFVADRVLIFAEGGGVTAGVSTGVVDTTPPVTINTTVNTAVTGWAAGGGLEYAIDPNWSIKGEALELGLRKSINQCAAVGGFPAGTTDCTYTRINDVTLVDVGVNYRFGSAPPPAPPLATKY